MAQDSTGQWVDTTNFDWFISQTSRCFNQIPWKLSTLVCMWDLLVSTSGYCLAVAIDCPSGLQTEPKEIQP